jgi:hypothetical protein
MTDVAVRPARSIEPSALYATRLLAAASIVVIGLLVAVELQLIGTLYAAELVLLALLPFTLLARRQVDRWISLFVLLGLAWLWSQFITDLIRQSAFVDYSRGWSKIGLVVINLLILWALLGGRRHRLLLFASGLALGLAFRFAFFPSDYALGDPWKFGLALPVTLGIAIAASTELAQSKWFLQPALLSSASFLNILLGFRSLAGVCFLAAVVLTLRSNRTRGRRLRPVALIAIGIAAASAFVFAYGRAAKEGLLGPAAAVKYDRQSRGDLGIILAARPELYAAMLAIRDSPLLGHGSWAADPKYRLEMSAELRSRGYIVHDRAQTSDVIPSHSHILGAWVDGGFLGALFWAAVIALCVITLGAIRGSPTFYAPLGALLATLLLWDILFSPFGADRRVTVPFAIVVLVSTLRDTQRLAHSGRLPADLGNAT